MPKSLVFRQHAIKRMFERSISVTDIEQALLSGSVVEAYPTDTPYPSGLWMGFSNARPLHAVIAESPTERIVITVYEPDLSQWHADWKTRKKP